VQTLAVRAPFDARRHGELLAPLVAEVLADAGAQRRDLGGVVVGVGPGPFTSLRVGIVTGAALADVLGVPVVGICSLDGVADAARPHATATPGSLVVATDARRREVYWARYRDGQRVQGPEVARPAVLAEQLAEDERVVGSGAALYADVFGPHADPSGPRWPDPAGLVARAWPALAGNEPVAPLTPLYLRRPDAVPPGAPKSATPATAASRAS
jgi:tRNA threonylcarbamoyl adenosine modification protein YeaZ